MSRQQFVRSNDLSGRERRCAERGWSTRKEKVFRRYEQRHHYLGRRVTELQKRIGEADGFIARLHANMLRGPCMLILPDDTEPEVRPPGGAQPDGAQSQNGACNEAPTIFEKQSRIVGAQAFSTLLVLQQEQKRDRLQLGYTLEAKSLLEQGTLKTDAGVKAADEKVYELLNDASVVRHEFSLLQIAADVAKESGGANNSWTILRWVREFKKHHGYFRREARDVHERNWIMFQGDLRMELTAFLRGEERFNIGKARSYVNDVLLSREGGMLKLDEYNLTVPTSCSTVHSWLMLLGCTYDGHTQSYDMDDHERPDVVESREAYIRQKRIIALRQPVWVRIVKSCLPPQELERLDTIRETGDQAFCAEAYDCEVDGKACVELHVDFLKDVGCVEAFDKLREELGPDGGHYSLRFDEAAAIPCQARHSPGVCKCDKQVYHIGQGESVYKAYTREGEEWAAVMTAVGGTTEGAGEMVSAFQDEIRGFGLRLSAVELKRVNAYRRGLGRKALTTTPGTRFIAFGENKGGCWKFEQFERQVIDVMDVLEALFPKMQIVVEVNHPAGHAKPREDGLHVSNMNVKYGGKQRVLRESTMTEGCLGPGAAKMYLANGEWSTTPSKGATEFDMKPQVSGTHSMTFASDAPPPFYAWDAPLEDQVVGTKRKRTSGTGNGVEGEKDKIKEGYAGKPKGIKQVGLVRGRRSIIHRHVCFFFQGCHNEDFYEYTAPNPTLRVIVKPNKIDS